MKFPLLCVLLLFFTACTNSDTPAPVPTRRMPVYICIQDEAHDTRVLPGDPGLHETLTKPQYAYIYVAAYKADGTLLQVCTLNERLTDNTPWGDPQSLWTLVDGTSNVWQYTGHAIYLSLPNAAVSATAYIALSYSALNIGATPTTEDEIKALTFRIDTDPNGNSYSEADRQDLLRNLYSTPYNRLYQDSDFTPYGNRLTDSDKAAAIGKYYGTILGMHTGNPLLLVTAYHTAARLDLTWEVEESAQDTKQLQHLQVNGLSYTGYLFQPTNPIASSPTYDYTLPTFNNSTSLSGRHSLYCLYNHTINLTYRLGNNPNADYTHTISAEDHPETYVPWLRGFITIK